jgi:hypothetical protein
MKDNPNSEEDGAALRRELDEWLPRLGDTLFKDSSSALRVDPLGYSDPRFPTERSMVGRSDLYSEGYLHAGDRLVDGLTGSSDEDELLYPVFFLYRHHLEMELKGRVKACLNHGLSGLAEDEIASVREKLALKHGLRSLWQILKKCYPECDRDFSAGTREAFDHLLRELDDLDPSSQAARYSLDRKGNQTLPCLASLDLRELRKNVHKMSHYLAAIREGLYQELDWRDEMASW